MQRREWLELTLAGIADAVITADLAGGVVFTNRLAEELTGWSSAEAKGKPMDAVFRAVEESTRRPIESPLRAALEENRVIALPGRALLVAKDGTERGIDGSAAPIRNASGRLIGAVITFRDVTQGQRTEQDVKLHGRVLESMVEGVSLADENGIIVYTNPAEDRIFGYERGELIGRHVSVQNTYPPEENRRIVTAIIERLKSDGSWSGEFSNRKKDGTEFTTHARITALETGGKQYFVCVQEDITERKRAEQALADARARLDAALDAGAIATWTWDIANNRLFADKKLAQLFNLPPSEAEGGSLEHYVKSIHPDDVSRVMATLAAAVERDEVYEADYRVVQADGSMRWVAARGRAQRDAAGRPARMPGVLVDITERKRLEEELRLRASQLRESEEKLSLLADTIPQLAWMARPDGHIFWYNRRWYEYTGTTAEQMEGWGWQSVHDPQVLPSVVERWRASIASGEPFDMVFPLRGADGRFRPFLTRVNPLRGSEGHILYWFGTNTDISDIKRMEEALREADRRKDEFLATLAHELRNPLAPLRNSLEILKMPRVDAATACQAREMMERQVHSLVRLVDDLLDVARVMRGKIELRKEPVELATVVARAVETVQPLLEARGHRLELALPNQSLLVHADTVRLAQVIANLLTNAAKYTEAAGSIRLSAKQEADQVVVCVRDDGIGIAPDMLPHIFELFVQADHAFTKAQGGLGIGLTLVKNLAQMHGGTVEARSDGLGKGAEFTLRMPLLLGPPSEPTEPASEHARQAPSGRHRLLVVDDNEDAAVSLAMLLRLKGYDVRVAHNGRAALNLAQSFRPHLVFLDLGMPDMDGYEVAGRMRRQAQLESLTLVALTGWGQEADRRRTASAGFRHHLVKPPEPKALAAVLEELERAVAVSR